MRALSQEFERRARVELLPGVTIDPHRVEVVDMADYGELVEDQDEYDEDPPF